LKSTKTKDLESIREQAFGYKVNNSECVYVITSNFEKLRFYINNAVDFDEFNLFTLNEEQFELLYLCLHKENILNNVPLKIKTDSVVAEESITKKFYSDYSQFKRELFRDLVKQNLKNEIFRTELQKEDTDRATKNIKQALFKKSQKLIDRFLFIFFAEDKGLLPPNSTLRILKDWDKLNDLDTNIPLYNRFKLYFKYLDEGRKGTDKKAEIFAYNGGLFKPDAILDSLILDSQMLYKHTKALSDYDFESQVGVNILGHIFENSLNEIESVNAEIEGKEFDKQKTKRKKDGVFYTPKYITKYIVDNTIGKLCEEKKQELEIKEEEYHKSRKGRKTDILKKLKTKLDNYRNWLLTLTILDPACGSGAFLNQALDFLIKEHTYIDELETSLVGGGMVMKNIENTILENNIYGVDLNEESVEIAKLSLWLRTAQPRRKLNTLNNNIKCGNSLIDSKAVAGDKAFNWQKEFPHIFIEKKKKVWHITTATHNSRYSQRMFDNNVKTGDAIWIDEKSEIIITKTIAEIVKKDNLNVVEYNICGDHMHLLLVCDEEELTKIVGKIKGKSSRLYHSNKGINPFVRQNGEKAVALWTQKFGKSEIKDENYLNNAIEYIRNNRVKHELPKSKEIEKLKKEFLCSKEHAFRTEYNGGFDVVIGNPPYGAEFSDSHKNYFIEKYKLSPTILDTYLLFLLDIQKLGKRDSVIGFIIPSTWMYMSQYKEFRQRILIKFKIPTIRLYRNPIFEDATVETCITFLKNSKPSNNFFYNYIETYEQEDTINESIKQFSLVNIDNDSLLLKNHLETSLFEKISDKGSLIKTFTSIVCGLTPYRLGKGKPPQSSEIVKGKLFDSNNKKDDTYRKYLMGRDFNRYLWQIQEERWISYGDWLAEPRRAAPFDDEIKIIVRQTSDRIIAHIDTNKYLSLKNVHNIRVNDSNIDYHYLVGLLNSKLIDWWYQKLIPEKGRVFAEVKVVNLKKLPIVKIKNTLIVRKVKVILSLNSDLHKTLSKFLGLLQSELSVEKLSKKIESWHILEWNDFEKELKKLKITLKGEVKEDWFERFNRLKEKAQSLKTEIEKTDKEIDQMVYELYGLSEEEISIIENS